MVHLRYGLLIMLIASSKEALVWKEDVLVVKVFKTNANTCSSARVLWKAGN